VNPDIWLRSTELIASDRRADARKTLGFPMTKTELLKATGNIWRVDCWHDGNRRRIVQTLYIRASDVLKAEEVGRRESGRRCVDAAPWNPKTDRKVFGYVQEVSNVGN